MSASIPIPYRLSGWLLRAAMGFYFSRIEGTNVADLPLPPLRHGASDHPNRMVQLFYPNGTGVGVPANVRELREVQML
jgi:hypothetical protein